MLEIIGWIIVGWLIGSTIYSTQLHLRNYVRSRDKDIVIAQQMDSPSHVEPMIKKNFLKKVLGLQLCKISIMLILLYFLTK